MLVYHGKSRDACEWVIKMFKDDPLSKHCETTQNWIKACEEYLQQLETTNAGNNL
jgi:hypothetical protein